MKRQTPEDDRKLLDFFESVFVPLHMQHTTEQTKHTYRMHVRRFARFSSLDITIGRITPRLLESWRGSLTASGYAPGSTDRILITLGLVLTAADPERFPPKGRGRPSTKLDPGTMPDDSLAKFVEAVYIPIRLAGGAESTKRQYRAIVRRFSEFLCRQATFDDLTETNVLPFIEALASSKRQPSAATVRGVQKKLASLWEFAFRRGKVTTAPDMRPWKEPKRLPTCWTLEELGRLLAAARATPGWIAGVPAGLWWEAILLLCYETGARIGAVLQISLVDIDVRRRLLAIPAENQKQFAEQRFFLTEQATAAVKASIAACPQRNALFPWAKCEATLYHHFRHILERAGLPTGRRDKFHKLRRTSATQIARVAGKAAASEHLGHSSLRVTAAYIDGTQIDDGLHLCDRLPRPIEPEQATGGAA